MSDDKLQAISGEIEEKPKKKGHVKSSRAHKYRKFGPNSPIPAKWRVFEFIEYRIQDNKRESESESMSREFIIENTGICPNHFSRIIKSLVKDNLIRVKPGNYRDSCATYSLCKIMFPDSVICPDLKREKIKTGGDNFHVGVDKFDDETTPNTKMVSETGLKHQNGVTKHQNGVERPVTTMKSLADSSLRSLSPRSLEKKSLRSLEESKAGSKESYTLPVGDWVQGQSEDEEKRKRRANERFLANLAREEEEEEERNRNEGKGSIAV